MTIFKAKNTLDCETVVISDTHYLMDNDSVRHSAGLLQGVTTKELVLNGDILDIERVGKIWDDVPRRFNRYELAALSCIIRHADDGAKVSVTPGNHDPDLAFMRFSDFGLRYVPDHEFTTHDGRRLLITHGDRPHGDGADSPCFDPLLDHGHATPKNVKRIWDKRYTTIQNALHYLDDLSHHRFGRKAGLVDLLHHVKQVVDDTAPPIVHVSSEEAPLGRSFEALRYIFNDVVIQRQFDCRTALNHARQIVREAIDEIKHPAAGLEHMGDNVRVLKYVFDNVVHAGDRAERNAILYALEKGYDGIWLGHTHWPKKVFWYHGRAPSAEAEKLYEGFDFRPLDDLFPLSNRLPEQYRERAERGILSLNSGDGVENSTALAYTKQGKFEFIRASTYKTNMNALDPQGIARAKELASRVSQLHPHIQGF